MAYHHQFGVWSGAFRRGIAAAVVGLLAQSPSVAKAAELAIRWIGVGVPDTSKGLSLADLDALPQHIIRTTTPWTQGVQVFSGPSLADVGGLTGLAPVAAELHALNDYSVVVPAEDWQEFKIVIATRVNGSVPRVFEKGPYWLMYPLDDMETPIQQKYVSRMIWQIESITFVDK